MASTCASLVAPVAVAKVATPAKQTSFNGLARMPLNKVQKNSFASRTVSNGIKTRQMLVWQPTNNKWVLARRLCCMASAIYFASRHLYLAACARLPCVPVPAAASTSGVHLQVL